MPTLLSGNESGCGPGAGLSGEAAYAGVTRLNPLLENLPIGIYLTTPEGRVLAANTVLVNMLGYASADELAALDLNAGEFAPEYQRAEFRERVEREGEVKALESAWRRRDGTTIYARENVRAVRDARGRVLYYEGTVEDVTERRRADAERQVMFEIIEGVNTTANLDELLRLIHSSLGQVLYAENCYVALYDPASELLHMQFFTDRYDQAPPPQQLGRGRTAYVFRTGRPSLMTEEVFQQLAGWGEVEQAGTAPASWLGVPLRTPSATLGVLVVQHYEDARAYSAKDLEFLNSVGGQVALAIERKRAEEALRLYAARLARSNRELQDFASVASHDLQEPLRKIQAFGDRLKAKCGDALSGEGRDYLERMQHAAGRMQTLINDLLTFSRVATKGQPFAPVDLNVIAREVISDLEVRIEQTRGRVEVGELMTVEADPSQMRQLLQNLIGNALKFGKEGTPPAVDVTCQPASPTRHLDGGNFKREMCQLFVTDNGIGFEEKYLEKIFTVFQRLHGRGAYEGTGVGLAVCRRIAERHGGSITARSTPGAGATFVVTLPVKQNGGGTSDESAREVDYHPAGG